MEDGGGNSVIGLGSCSLPCTSGCFCTITKLCHVGPHPIDDATTHIHLMVQKPVKQASLKHTLMVPMVILSWAGNLDGELPWNSGFFLMLPRRHSGLHGISVPAVLDFDIFGSANEWMVGWRSGAIEHTNNVAEAVAIARFLSLCFVFMEITSGRIVCHYDSEYVVSTTCGLYRPRNHKESFAIHSSFSLMSAQGSIGVGTPWRAIIGVFCMRGWMVLPRWVLVGLQEYGHHSWSV